jgi:hypothetical protein
MEMISVAALAARRALATSEFAGYVALTEQLPQIGLTVSEAVCRDSWRVIRIGKLLC